MNYPQQNMNALFSLYDRIPVDNKSNLLYNLEKQTPHTKNSSLVNDFMDYNHFDQYFFSSKNKNNLVNLINEKIIKRYSITQININYYTILENGMNYIYNKLNRYIRNDIHETLQLFNREVVNHVMPSIYEEMNAYKKYVNNIDKVVMPNELPKQHRNFKQLSHKNFYL